GPAPAREAHGRPARNGRQGTARPPRFLPICCATGRRPVSRPSKLISTVPATSTSCSNRWSALCARWGRGSRERQLGDEGRQTCAIGGFALRPVAVSSLTGSDGQPTLLILG